MAEPVLAVRDLHIGYRGPGEIVRAVHGASFELGPGEVLGLVGESGSGKSTLALGMLRWLPPPGVILGGTVELRGQNLLALDEEALRRTRWTQAALVPQNALDALNPVLRVGAQVIDTLLAHSSLTPTAARQRAAELFRLVDLDPVHLDAFPHQLSGGMRQRVTLGLALAFDPPLVVLDEPTTALDVVVEREILGRVLELQRQRGFAMVFVTHAVPLLLLLATRIAVLYAGRIAEIGPVAGFRLGGTHPYSRGLVGAIPPAVDEDREAISIPGSPPNVARPPSGCPFHPRCAYADATCVSTLPVLRTFAPGHAIACHYPRPQ